MFFCCFFFLSHGGRDPHRAWATSLWMLSCTRLASFADCLLVNLSLSSQQFFSQCNPLESLLVCWSVDETQQTFNENLFLFLFRPSPFFVPLCFTSPVLPSLWLSSTSLLSVASSQGGYAAYRYAQPAAVATPAAAAAAAAAYSDRWVARYLSWEVGCSLALLSSVIIQSKWYIISM